VKSTRPVNLDLTTISFPPMAIASILHRISGMVLFLLLPIMLYFLASSLKDPQSFAMLQASFSSVFYKLILWAFFSALIFHLLAGIRHMIMDLGYGEEVDSGRRGAILVIALTVVLTIVLGIWLW